MGQKDTITKEYMRDAEIFADAFNFLLYDGQQVIKPHQLREMDTSSIALLYGDSAVLGMIQKYRDILRSVTAMEDENTAYLILGIEDQSKIHYSMPVRNNLYDAIQYANQADGIANAHKKAKEYGTDDEFLSGFHKDDKLLPVVTLVVYWGTKPWDAPKSLHEMLKTDDKRILSFVPDYKINLIAPNEIADEDFEKFHTDLNLVFKFMKYAGNRKKMKSLMYEDEMFKNVPKRTANLLNTVANLNLKIQEREEDVNMCQAIQEMIDEAVAEKEEAIQEMMAEKERAIQEAIAEKEEAERKAKIEAEKKNIENMKRMINSKKQFAFEDIAEIFGVSVEFVENMAKGQNK